MADEAGRGRARSGARSRPAPRIRWFRRLPRNRSVVVGAAIFLVFLLAALFADLIATHVPTPPEPAPTR